MGFEKRNKEYFRVIKGYTFDKRLFWAASAIIVLIAVAGIAQYGFGENHIYLECPEDAPGGACFNPLYSPFCDGSWYCQDETLVAGFSYGEKPPFLITYFGAFVAAILAVAFASNHVAYNGGV